MEVSLADLESMALSAGLESLVSGGTSPSTSATLWQRFEGEVRAAHARAMHGLQALGGDADMWGQLPRTEELLRLLQQEEQTRCQAFQAAMMGEVPAHVYQATVRSILEKLLGKLEALSGDQMLYRGAARCLSEYMSSLNHHCDTCVVPCGAAPMEADRSMNVIFEAEDAFESEELYSESSSDIGSAGYGEGGRERAATWGAPGSFQPGTAPLQNAAPGLTGPLSAEERKQRRRESNRAASSKYRSKKSGTVSTLMADNNQLRGQMAQLGSQNAVLTAENQLLKQQVAFLQGILKEPPAPKPAA
jgi:hypothetical protein